MEGYIAEIRMFAGNFAPRSWAFCQGQLLSIAQNTALFSLLGTTYGGNGQTTFGLPDFRGRVAVGTGQGPGLPNVILGEMAGVPTTTLIITNLPAHNHAITGTATLKGNNHAPNSTDPTSRFLAASNIYTNQSGDMASMNAGAISLSLSTGIAGSNQPFNNMQPYLGMNYIICLEGIFPSRN